MGLTLVTPATNPVTLTEAKAWCRVDDNASDSVLTMLLEAAFEAVQLHVGRSLFAQTWKLVLDGFTSAIELPKGPVTGISAFTYVDPVGATRTVDEGLWTLDLVSDPQWIVLNEGESWPEALDAVNVVSVTFTAGYAALPDPIKLAVLMLVSSWFDSRAPGAVPASVCDLLRPFRRVII